MRHLVSKHNIFYLLLILLSFFCSNAHAQDTTSSDGLFAEARKAAFKDDNYPKAIYYCKKALGISPHYTDILVFTGRLYTWSKNYDSAVKYFNEAITGNPNYEDAYVAYINLEYWNDHNDKALAICQKGLQHIPGSITLSVLKAKILYAMRQYKPAVLIVDSVLKVDKTNTQARSLADKIKDEIAHNKVTISYDYIHFDKQFDDPWRLGSIGYARNTKAGTFIATLNYANRFKKDGFQYEIEGYPHISKRFYGYFDAGYSDSVGVFPHWRAGGSLFANLPHAYEAELGIRYLYFTDPTDIFTAYIGKYYKNYLFGVRTYLTPSNNNISQSYSGMVRYYYGNADDYVGLTAGTGISPDDRLVNYQLNSNYKLITFKAGIDLSYCYKRLNILLFNASIINQEYLPGVKGNQMQIGMTYQRRF